MRVTQKKSVNVQPVEPNKTSYPEFGKIIRRQRPQKSVNAVFLDRDGTINDNGPGYIHKIEDFKFLPHVLPALKKLSKTGFKIIIATNQSGISRGFYTEAQMKKLHRWMLLELKRRGIRIDGIFYCPHGPADNCLCRKPLTGMLKKVAVDFNINFKDSWLVGDDIRDITTGHAAGVKTIKLRKGGEEDETSPDFYAGNLLEAVGIILRNSV